MNIKHFIKDRKYLILLFSVMICFIWGTAYLDRANRMLTPNIAYMVIVCCILFFIYLAVEYTAMRGRYKNIEKLLASRDMDWLNNLPQASNYDQEVFIRLLLKLYDQANERVQQYKDKGREDVEFLTSWVHEIKTPIAVSRLIIENNIKNPTPEALESIQEELVKIEQYVQRVLYYSMINDFARDYIIIGTNLEGIVKDAVKRHVKSFINKKISISMNVEGYEAYTDKKWLGFILDQIISNAVKYTENQGCIKIYGEVTGDETLLHISDNGIGIKEEDMCRIFNKSFTGFNGRERYGSTGMGLYLSQKLAKKLGHYITMDSTHGHGTTVTVHFPKWTDYFDMQ